MLRCFLLIKYCREISLSYSKYISREAFDFVTFKNTELTVSFLLSQFDFVINKYKYQNIHSEEKIIYITEMFYLSMKKKMHLLRRILCGVVCTSFLSSPSNLYGFYMRVSC